MRVSESEKLGVSVLGCHFSEKAEHIPIKKRRFLFKASSPPHHETSPRAFNQEIKVNPNPNPNPNPICVHESVTQVVKKELMKAKHEPKEDDDFSGISILAAAACSNCLGAEADRCEGSGIGIRIGIAKSTEAPTTIELKESISKSAKEESDSHTSRKESESMMESVIPTPKDVRFNWDLNTVMDDPWEEPFVSEHEVSSHNNVTFIKEKKDDCTKVNSRDCGIGIRTESGIPSKDISILNDENELKLGSSKPEPMSCELDNSQHSVAVAESAIPVTLENPTPGIFSKWQTSCDTEAVDTKLSMDCSVPPGFNHRLNLHISKENMVAESPIPVPCKPEFEKHDLSLTPAASMENGALSSKADESMVKMETTSMRDSEAKLENGISYDNSRGGSGYDSQYEDGELRESSINAWKGEEHELVINNREDDNHDLNIGITDSHESKSSPTPCTQVTSPGIKPEETDLTSNVVLPEILDNNTDEVLTGSEPNEMVTNSNSNSNERQEFSIIHHQSDEWKMNVSGLDHLPENQRIPSSNFTKTRNFTGRKFSYGVQKDGFDPEDVETKGEGSRFYRKEPITRIGGPSTRDVFLTRGRFRVQGCSSNAGERESGVVRSMGRGSGRYSPPPPPPHNRVWNRSPDRKNRLPSPTYPGPPFLRPMLEDSGTLDNNNIITEPSMDPTEPNSRPNTSSSYLTRRPFRSRSPMNREANDFRARLGLRPTADTSDHRFMTRGRGRGRVGIRYGTRVENNQPGRYHGPGSDECDEFITDYPNPFPRRRRCFSPVERRGSGNGNHYSGSRSPSRPRTRSPVSTFRRRSRSPSFRIRRPRSPNYRRGFDPEFRGNTSPPLNPRWVNYKERPTVFVERERERERFSFYERKPKQNEFYRSGQRFDPTESGRGRPRYIDDSETDRTNNNNGYRRGGFVRRYNNNMDGHAHGHVKRFHYDDGDGFGRGFDARDKHALEAHARGNMKSSSTDAGGSSRFRDFSRRSREEDRRSRERKDSSADPTKDEKEKHIVVKDQSNLHPIISVKEKEGDSSKTNANVGL